MTALPVLVAHAKRWLSLAMLHAGRNHGQPSQPVGELQTLLSRLSAWAGPDGAVLLGVVFPIGQPLVWSSFHFHLDREGLCPQMYNRLQT